MVKIWGGYGRGAVSKKEKSASAVKTAYAKSGGISPHRQRGFDPPRPIQKQQNIIDFETLFSWYNEQNTPEPVAVGDEVSETYIAAHKQSNLKFMLL